MSTELKDRPTVGRKKRERPAKTTRLDADLVTKAKAMADDAGLDAAKYLSDLIRPVVDREWIKFQRRIMEGDEN
jgi:hypothetical protein